MIGAVFAMISALFCVMVVLVASAAAGREIHDELERIRRGEKPAEDEVRRQWDQITTEARSRWEVVRVRVDEYRNRKRGDDPPNCERPSARAVVAGGEAAWSACGAVTAWHPEAGQIGLPGGVGGPSDRSRGRSAARTWPALVDCGRPSAPGG